MSPTVVVVSPGAGSGRAGWLWNALRERHRELAQAHVINTPDAERAGDELEAALGRGVDRVLVFGGDGTMHGVVNRVLRAGRGSDVALGLVPAGTGSDLARALDLPRDPEEALLLALSARPRAVDALRLDAADGRSRHAVNVVSAGVSGLVDTTINSMPRRGRLSFLRASLDAIRRYVCVPCRTRVDGELWYEGPTFLVAVANGISFGQGMRIAPLARIDDGLADVVLIERVPRPQLLLRVPQIYLGAHLRSRLVRWGRGAHVRIEPLGPLPPFDVDGELMDPGVLEITVLPRALRVLADGG